MIEVDGGILAWARVSVGLAFVAWSYVTFAPPVKAIYARIRKRPPGRRV